jgi:hypothetical protein
MQRRLVITHQGCVGALEGLLAEGPVVFRFCAAGVGVSVVNESERACVAGLAAAAGSAGCGMKQQAAPPRQHSRGLRGRARCSWRQPCGRPGAGRPNPATAAGAATKWSLIGCAA